MVTALNWIAMMAAGIGAVALVVFLLGPRE